MSSTWPFSLSMAKKFSTRSRRREAPPARRLRESQEIFHTTFNWPIAQSRSCFVIKFSLMLQVCFCPLCHRHSFNDRSHAFIAFDFHISIALVFIRNALQSNASLSLDVRPPVECCSRRQRRPSLQSSSTMAQELRKKKRRVPPVWQAERGRVMSAAALWLFLCWTTLHGRHDKHP